MFYVDTSALVPLFIREPKSEAVVELIESSGERLAISEWCLVEFASAASIKVRTGQTGALVAKQAVRRLRLFAQRHCLIAAPGRDDFRRAAELAGDSELKLRAGDALHLAVAAALRVRGLVCFDESMIIAARAVGIDVVTA